MTLQQFKRDFICEVDIRTFGNINLIITSFAIRRIDKKVIDRIKYTIDIQETNEWINDSNSMLSVTPWNWEMFIDHAKRAQLDCFARRVPIDDFYPMNASTNISAMFI